MIKWLKRITEYGYWTQNGKSCREWNIGKLRFRIGSYETSITIDKSY